MVVFVRAGTPLERRRVGVGLHCELEVMVLEMAHVEVVQQHWTAKVGCAGDGLH